MNDLPKVIAQYFHFKNTHDKEGLLSVFSNEAFIVDRGEKKEIRGKDQIGTWIDKSLSGLNLHTEISQVKVQNGNWVIETIVCGDFSASPAKFIYHLEIVNDKIEFLDIEFAGSLKG